MRREKNKFFSRVLEGGYSSKQEILAKGKGYGLVDAPYYLLVVSKPDVVILPFDHRKDAIIELIEGELVHQKNQSIFFMKEDLFIFLCPIFSMSETIESQIGDWLLKLQDLIEDTFQITFSFGMGNYVEGVLDVKDSFLQAKNELDMGSRLGKRKFIQHGRNQSVGKLLSLIPTPNLREFYEKTLKELAQPLDQDKIGLLDTLNLYFKNNGNIAETAKQLFVHRNTVIYRLQKCEDILGENLKDPDVAFELRLALLIQTLI
jgi:purine catabolism regulator